MHPTPTIPATPAVAIPVPAPAPAAEPRRARAVRRRRRPTATLDPVPHLRDLLPTSPLASLATDCVQWRLVRALPKLLRNRQFKKQLRAAVGAPLLRQLQATWALGDADWDRLCDEVNNLYWEKANQVLVLTWDATCPLGSSGASYILEWGGVYAFRSTDWPADGPYDSLQQAVDESGSFYCGSTQAGLGGPTRLVRRLALEVCGEGEVIEINGELWKLRRGKLRRYEPPPE